MKEFLIITATFIILIFLRYFNFSLFYSRKRWIFLRWRWWRMKGCYLFKTCPRCLIPNSGQICKKCQQDCNISL